MGEKGKAMTGMGEASGKKRLLAAAETAISNPLIEDPSIKRASGLLIDHRREGVREHGLPIFGQSPTGTIRLSPALLRVPSSRAVWSCFAIGVRLAR